MTIRNLWSAGSLVLEGSSAALADSDETIKIPINKIDRPAHFGAYHRHVVRKSRIPIGSKKTLLRFGHYVPRSHPQTALSAAAIACFKEKMGWEDIDLNLWVHAGLCSDGFDQGRYMIDKERSSNSEHLAHHFHRLVYSALHGKSS